MIIQYDKNPNFNTDQKLQSLIESIQLALNELAEKRDLEACAKPQDLEAYLKLTGGELTGDVTLIPNADSPGLPFIIIQGNAGKNSMFTAKRTDTNVSVGFGIGAGGINHGIWSENLGKWMIHGDDSNVYVNLVKQITIPGTQATKVGNYWTGGSITLYRRGNIVHLTGMSTLTALTGRTTVAKIDNVDLRPYAQEYVQINGSNDYLLINTDGTIQFNAISAGTKHFSANFMAAT